MNHSHPASLPVELLIDVASHLAGRPADLRSLTLVNVPFNSASTPILYNDITLRDPSATRACLATLNRDLSLCTFHRDLPSLVRSVVIDWVEWYAEEGEPSSEEDKDLFEEALDRSVMRMHNVQCFCCWESFMFTPRTFARLVAGPAGQSLQVLRVTMEDWCLPFYALTLEEQCKPCARLREIQFILPSRQKGWEGCCDYVAHVLNASATSLESLVIDPSSHHANPDVPTLFSNTKSWPALDVLRVPTATNLLALPNAPSLRCLHLDCDYSRIGLDGVPFPPPFTLTSNDSTAVTSTSQRFCPPTLTPAVPSTPSFWTKPVLATMQCLLNSAVPVTQLTLYLQRIVVTELPYILPYVKHLEQLVIVSAGRPKNLRKAHFLGKTMLAHMPRLHTFLLCGTAETREKPSYMYRPYRYFYTRQEMALRVYDKYAPGLRRVMFTVGLEWVKKADGTWDAVKSQ